MANENKRVEDDVIDLGALFWAFLRLLRRFWWIIPILALAAAAAGCIRLQSSYVPMYRSEASFTVVTEGGENDGFSFYYDNLTAGQLDSTFPYILSSSLLTDAIREDLGTERINGSISASVIPNSNLVTMSVTSTSAADARAILESAIRVYPEVSRFVIGATRFNMIDPPTEPDEPYNTLSYRRTAAQWGLIGAGAALVLLVIGAFLKKTVQTTDELSSDLNLQCLGTVPEVRFKARGRRQVRQVSCLSGEIPGSFREGIQGLWLRVNREMEKNGCRVLLITSTAAGEGKTVAARNLAYTAASHGKRVLLVDADLRKQNGTGTEEAGLAEVVLKGASPEEVIRYDEESGIYLTGSGRPEGKIARLLSRREIDEFFAAARESMDLVIIDTPPCGPFSDAAVLAERADGILYVVRYDAVQKRRILEGVGAMEDTEVKLLGYVFNSIPVHGGGYGYYGYGRYGYGYYGYGQYGHGRSGYGRNGYASRGSEEEAVDSGESAGEPESDLEWESVEALEEQELETAAAQEETEPGEEEQPVEGDVMDAVQENQEEKESDAR